MFLYTDILWEYWIRLVRLELRCIVYVVFLQSISNKLVRHLNKVKNNYVIVCIHIDCKYWYVLLRNIFVCFSFIDTSGIVLKLT